MIRNLLHGEFEEYSINQSIQLFLQWKEMDVV